MSDEALGRLILALSEDTGDFPSDNFVSNETSYLHVAPALLDPAIAGRAYVGVGPEQNLTYIALARPRIAYIIDIRRENMLQHLVFRALVEESETREAFLSRLTSRPVAVGDERVPPDVSIDEICDRVSSRSSDSNLLAANEESAVALMARLGLPQEGDDRASIAKVLAAFARDGLDIRYSMERSRRPYPRLRDLLAARDDEGVQRGFLSSESSYQLVRTMLKANRVVPLVGDFLGDTTLAGVAADMRHRSVTLGAFYTSNVEQYLFPAKTYERFVKNVEAFPRDGKSVIVRVWFDQGKAHPAQREGHRTTSLLKSVDSFLERCHARPYRSYMEVALDSAPP
jgi:hypothetical protein